MEVTGLQETERGARRGDPHRGACLGSCRWGSLSRGPSESPGSEAAEQEGRKTRGALGSARGGTEWAAGADTVCDPCVRGMSESQGAGSGWLGSEDVRDRSPGAQGVWPGR